jgi:hypothetical protein
MHLLASVGVVILQRTVKFAPERGFTFTKFCLLAFIQTQRHTDKPFTAKEGRPQLKFTLPTSLYQLFHPHRITNNPCTFCLHSHR